MFGALHWDYLNRRGLVTEYPAQLGVAIAGSREVDEELHSQLLDWGVLVEPAEGGVELGESIKPVFDAFQGPALKVFGTTLIYRDAVPRPEMDADLPEPLRAMAEISDTVIPQGKFLVAVTDTVVSCAMQFRGHVAVSGVDCTHSDPVVQGARVLWEALAPGPGYESLQEMTVSMSALAAVAPVRVRDDGGPAAAAAALGDAGVGAPLSEAMVELLKQQPSAAAQVCVSVWNNHRRVDSEDAALALLEFDEGAVLSVPSWRRDGGVYVTYMPATESSWEKALAEFVERYRFLAVVA